jgi:hypothetical protein
LTSGRAERWSDLEPEAGIRAALDHAGERPETGDQNAKRRWSEKFANACAVAVATEFRRSGKLPGKLVLPESLEKGTEPLTPLGAGTSKRIDVTVVDTVMGLEIGVSLKGLNFLDQGSGNYDKNLTGRLYEMSDEVRLVHDHLPHAFMVGVMFLPLAACSDKTPAANSSFAHAVVKLRSRTGRLDAALAAHGSRCDAAYVGLYAVDSSIQDIQRGVVRFLNVGQSPPQRGRPMVATTLSLAELIDQIVDLATGTSGVSWADAEIDSP